MSELSIKKVKHVKSHILELTFSDGHIQLVDFAPFIFSNGHPDYDRYKTEEGFLTFDVVDGNLNWDDYTMIFPVEDLYRGKI
ncbi:DUF2442 domain-containing protein [Marinobacter caseinilyticus]|uniref:DUF2442 domain-containing protein n=1 Tax=Marinobacter caseinilyticus TaxID=2692195 RepID=UPI00140E6EB6